MTADWRTSKEDKIRCLTASDFMTVFESSTPNIMLRLTFRIRMARS